MQHKLAWCRHQTSLRSDVFPVDPLRSLSYRPCRSIAAQQVARADAYDNRAEYFRRARAAQLHSLGMHKESNTVLQRIPNWLLYPLRVLAVFLALATLIGFVWFLGHHRFQTVFYFFASLAALLTFAFLSRREISSSAKGFVLSLAALAILATIPQLYLDLTLVNGPDYGGFTVRLIEVGIFIAMAIETVTLSNKGKHA